MEWVAGGRASKAFAQAEPCASGEAERERGRCAADSVPFGPGPLIII